VSETPQTLPELIEALSAIEHERWSDWQKYMHSMGWSFPDDDGTLMFHKEQIERWERQINTPYDKLSEREQRSDREQVLRYWPLFVAFVAAWMTEWYEHPDRSDFRGMVDDWREEMSEENAENWVTEASMTREDWAQAATYD
jgi:hypothetical protein